MQAVDYVIVGAGTAGCILAARLSQNPEARVALLEFGGADSSPTIWDKDVNALVRLWAPDAAENWGYTTVEQNELNGRAIPVARGKVLGGCSAINAMLYIRGNRGDFDGWSGRGNRGWSYQEILPYFKKSEAYQGPPSHYHGRSGPLSVIDYRDPSPVSQAFVEAAAELGAPAKYNDFNGATQEGGAGLYQSTRTLDGVRVTAASAFIRPILNRENLRVLTNVRATRLVFERRRVVGVAYASGENSGVLRAEREVVLCCGAFETPKLMMLSGLGCAEQLARQGISVVENLPGVGANLQDHLMVGVGFSSKVALRAPQLLAEAGLFTSTAGGVNRSSPDLQYFFGPLQFAAPWYQPKRPVFTFAPILIQPRSRGTVALASRDPGALARVDMRYLSREEDAAVLEYGIRYARELAHSRSFAGLRGDELTPGREVKSSSQLHDYIRRTATTVWHAAGTCKMDGGGGGDAVVDDQLRVYGVEGLRVADASIMPSIVSGNPNAAVMMIAEKAADLIALQHSDRRPAGGWSWPVEAVDAPDVDARQSATDTSGASPLERRERLRARIAGYRALVAPLLVEAALDREPKKQLYALVSKQLLRDGEGIRAALCVATCGALGGSAARALPSAAAMELLHSASLLRHEAGVGGEPPAADPGPRRKGSVPRAINVGNAMNVMSARVLRQNASVLDPELCARVLDEFDHMSIELTEGQAMELGRTHQPAGELTEGDYLVMVLKRTGWGGFIHPLRVGALIAGVPLARLDSFSRFGHFLANALQIQEDALQLMGGKDERQEICGDLLQGHHSLVLSHVLRVSTAPDRERLTSLLAKPRAERQPGELSWMSERVSSYGGLEYARGAALKFVQEARREFETAYAGAPKGDDEEFLRSLLDYVQSREMPAKIDRDRWSV